METKNEVNAKNKAKKVKVDFKNGLLSVDSESLEHALGLFNRKREEAENKQKEQIKAQKEVRVKYLKFLREIIGGILSYSEAMAKQSGARLHVQVDLALREEMGASLRTSWTGFVDLKSFFKAKQTLEENMQKGIGALSSDEWNAFAGSDEVKKFGKAAVSAINTANGSNAKKNKKVVKADDQAEVENEVSATPAQASTKPSGLPTAASTVPNGPTVSGNVPKASQPGTAQPVAGGASASAGIKPSGVAPVNAPVASGQTTHIHGKTSGH